MKILNPLSLPLPFVHPAPIGLPLVLREVFFMIGIYKITSPNGKIYIGQSTNIKSRFTDYNPLKNKVKSQTKLYNSLKKHNPINHTFEIIEECHTSILNERERYWQDFHDSVNNGLNCRFTKTNDKSGYMSDESKLKMSVSSIGHKQTLEHKNKITKTKIGRVLSEETKQKISKSHLLLDKETKKKSGKKPIGWTFSDEARKKMSMKRLGKKESVETRLKKSIAMKKTLLQKKLNTIIPCTQ